MDYQEPERTVGTELQEPPRERADPQVMGARLLLRSGAKRREAEREGEGGVESAEEREGGWEGGRPLDCTALACHRGTKLRIVELMRQGFQQGMHERGPVGVPALHTHMDSRALVLGNVCAAASTRLPAGSVSAPGARVPRAVSSSSSVDAVTASVIGAAVEGGAVPGHVIDSVEERIRARVMAMARAIDRGDTVSRITLSCFTTM